MSEEILVKVDNVSKKYCRTLKRSLWYGVQDITQEILGKSRVVEKLRTNEFWAVKDVSFELKCGECLGLIGQNGAGKSTVLKMLNGLIKPETGTITMRGKVGALIELGAGFNPILTGRENIYINGSVLGLTKKEIDKKFDSIIDFAEIEEFIDSPVQNYSSGMKVRLGFSIATHTEPDVLLIDEILAVGDISFVNKCLNRIGSILSNTAIIYVSHSMPQVSRICTHLMLMDKGYSIYQSENVSEGIDHYYSRIRVPANKFTNYDEAELKKISINKQNVQYGNSPLPVDRLSKMVIDLKFRVSKKYKNPEVIIVFSDRELRGIATFLRDDSSKRLINSDGNLEVQLIFEKILFSKGIYSITVGLADRPNGNILLRQQEAAWFQVISQHHIWTPFQIDGQIFQTN